MRGAPEQVKIRLLAINDFHGNLEPTMWSSPEGGQPELAGGAVPMAALIERLKLDQPNTLLVAAGDLVGASPMASAMQRDEPTIALLNHLGLTASAVGNHELDHGLAELRRLQRGGCPRPGCEPGEPAFAGANFTYLSANLFDRQSGRLVFAPYRIVTVGGARIALVGALVRSAADVVLAENLRGLRVDDEAESVNAVVPEIRAQGVRAIVLLLHEGAAPVGPVDARTCAGLEGPALQIVPRLDPEIDVIISGHSHQTYVCRFGGRLLSQAGSYGRWVTAIDLVMDRHTGDVLTSQASNAPAIASSTSIGDPAVQRLVADAVSRAAEVADQPIARLSDPQIRRSADANGESVLGRLIADAQLEAGKALGAQLACMNPGGVRQDLPATPKQAPVTYGDARATQPFGNRLKVLALTGAQLHELFEQQWKNRSSPYVLSCSDGLSYRFDLRRPSGQRLVPDSLRLHGRVIAAQGEYRLVVNGFLAGGGDSFPILTQGRDVGDAGSDVDALIAYLRAREPVAAPTQGRIGAIGARP